METPRELYHCGNLGLSIRQGARPIGGSPVDGLPRECSDSGEDREEGSACQKPEPRVEEFNNCLFSFVGWRRRRERWTLWKKSGRGLSLYPGQAETVRAGW